MLRRDLLDIGLRWLDRIVNPRLAPRVALLLTLTGVSLLGISSLFDFNAAGEVGSVRFAISQNADTIAQSFGALMIVLAIGLIMFDRLNPEPITLRPARTLNEASAELHKLLIQNKALFREYFPDNSAASTTQLRDPELWKEVRDLKIRPNNARILEILEGIDAPSNATEKDGVRRMLAHLIAFEAHLTNSDVDYSANRFPTDFPELVARLAKEVTSPSELLVGFKTFISEWLIENSIPIKVAGLFGSVLYLKNPPDVDLLLVLNCNSKEALKLSAMHLKKLKSEFRTRFGVPLHVLAPTESEASELSEFIQSIPRIENIQ